MKGSVVKRGDKIVEIERADLDRIERIEEKIRDLQFKLESAKAKAVAISRDVSELKALRAASLAGMDESESERDKTGRLGEVVGRYGGEVDPKRTLERHRFEPGKDIK